MNVLRHAAAGIAAAASLALGVAAVLAVALGGLFWIGGVYAGVALALLRLALHLRPRRRDRYVFARQRGSGYLPVRASR